MSALFLCMPVVSDPASIDSNRKQRRAFIRGRPLVEILRSLKRCLDILAGGDGQAFVGEQLPHEGSNFGAGVEHEDSRGDHRGALPAGSLG